MIKRIWIWIRKFIDPMWIPPEEMEAYRRHMLERIEMDRKRKEEIREHTIR